MIIRLSVEAPKTLLAVAKAKTLLRVGATVARSVRAREHPKGEIYVCNRAARELEWKDVCIDPNTNVRFSIPGGFRGERESLD